MKETLIVSLRKKDFSLSLEESFFVLDSLSSCYLKFNKKQKVRYATMNRNAIQDLIRDQNFVEKKYRKYIPLITKNLNDLHNKNYSEKFWMKTFNLSFKRLITIIYDSYLLFERNVNCLSQNIEIMMESSYYQPMDFQDSYLFFRDSTIGHEQIFSIYMKYFYPGSCLEFTYDKEEVEGPEIKKSRFKHILNKFKGQNIFNIISIVINHIYNKKNYDLNPEIGIIGSYFSNENLAKLIKKSKKKIAPLSIISYYHKSSNNKRNLKFDIKNIKHTSFDRFDGFFFYALQHLMPKIYLDDFENIHNTMEKQVVSQKQIKYVISEAWISNDYLSLLLALYSEAGVKHINNEHNFLSHQFLGNNNKLIAELSDIFVTLGWNSDKYSNLIVGASLYEFCLDVKRRKKNTVLYLTGFPFIKREDFSAAYGTSAESAYKYLNFKHAFFENLSNKVLKKLIYRGYPVNNRHWYGIDESLWLAQYKQKILKIDDFSLSSKEMMLRSLLVVSDYLSTTYIESMLMDIPTIFFWDTDTYYLNNDYSDFYDSLISVGICQTDPVEAARFVEEIKDNPNEWWLKKEVQDVKNDFLTKNIGDPQIMIDYLLSLSGTN